MAIQFKKLTATLSAGENNYTFTDGLINNSSVIEVYTDNDDVYPVDLSQSGNSVSITFSDHAEPVGIAITINNVVSYEPVDVAAIENHIETVSDGLSGLSTVVNELSDNVDNIEGDVSTLGTMVTDLETNKQDVLTAGENITIIDNVISSSGGSGGTSYSTQEQVIGTWIDGKPLYRKVVNVGNRQINSSWTNFVTNISMNALVKCIAITINSSDWGFRTYTPISAINSNKTSIDAKYYEAQGVNYFVIEYTKTTD